MIFIIEHALTEQVLDQRALLVSNDALFGASYKLASTCFAPVILLAAMNMAVLLELYRSTTLGTRP